MRRREWQHMAVAEMVLALTGIDPREYGDTDEEGSYIDLSDRKFRWAMIEEQRRRNAEKGNQS